MYSRSLFDDRAIIGLVLSASVVFIRRAFTSRAPYYLTFLWHGLDPIVIALRYA